VCIWLSILVSLRPLAGSQAGNTGGRHVRHRCAEGARKGHQIGDLAHLGERQNEATLLSYPVQYLRLVAVFCYKNVLRVVQKIAPLVIFGLQQSPLRGYNKK